MQLSTPNNTFFCIMARANNLKQIKIQIEMLIEALYYFNKNTPICKLHQTSVSWALPITIFA